MKIAASHSGITPGPDGVTHQAQEDLSIMRALAGSTVIAPADPTSTKMAVHSAAAYDGPVYLSFTRDPVPVLYDADVSLRDRQGRGCARGQRCRHHRQPRPGDPGPDRCRVSGRKGIDVRVIDCHTLKPLDERMVLKAARETGAIVTAENNIIFGGLGSAVAEVLVEKCPIPMKRIGVQDTFAESGPYLEVIDKYGLTARHIVKAVNEVLKRKPTVKAPSQAKPTSKPKAKATKSKMKVKAGRKL